MGDQLAKGWADSKAIQQAHEKHARNMAEFREDERMMFEAQQRRLLREYLAEEAAEEAVLP